MDNRVIIFDTTLRDGEQSPGASLNVHEKVEIARQLEKLNVDVIRYIPYDILKKASMFMFYILKLKFVLILKKTNKKSIEWFTSLSD